MKSIFTAFTWKRGLMGWIVSVSLCYGHISSAQTPVEKHGQLKVQGNRIVDKNGSPVQLRGMSFYWSQWKPAFYNTNVVKWLRDDWCVSVVRIAMAVDVGGYATNPTAEKNRVFTVVDAAIAHGIYVIIDFHVHEANLYSSQAETFFNEVSLKYKNVPNVLYETWNEPLAVSWPNVIKPYHQKIVNVIRKNDPDNIIICGTANWSQKVGDPAADPVSGGNIAYTLHYYADSHKQWLRDAAKAALDKGIALFVTEYGTCNANGNGTLNAAESNAWWSFLEANAIGHCNWSIADLNETSAALFPGASANGNWPSSALKPSGVLVRNYLKSKCTVVELPKDCNGVSGGLATTDACGVCAGGTTGKKPCKTLANGSYTIKPLHSNLCLEPGTVVNQQNCVNTNEQIWQVTKVGNFYELKNVASGQYLNVATVASGSSLTQTTTTTNRQWRLEDADNGRYHLVPYSNHSLIADVSGGATGANINVSLWTRTEGTNQIYSFTPAVVTHIDDAAKLDAYQAYPNPFKESTLVALSGSFDYVIYDVSGSIVESGQGQDELSIGKDLNKGIYILKTNTTNTSYTLKIVKEE